MGNFLFLAFLLGAGKFFYHRGFPEDFGKSLNLFVLNLSLPAMILYQVPKLTFNTDLIAYVVMPWSILLFSIVLLWTVFKFIAVDKGIRASLYLLIPLGNTSFVGIPMIEVFYGQSYIPQALIYDQFGTFLIFSTYGTILVALFSGEKVSLIKVLKKILFFPAFIALLISLFISIPQIFDPMLKILSLSLVPLALVSVGFGLRLKMQEHKQIFAIGLFIKLIVLPLAAIVIIKVIGFDINSSKIAIFEAGMGPMITAGILAVNAGFAPRFTGSVLGYGIIGSFVTLPILYLFIEMLI